MNAPAQDTDGLCVTAHRRTPRPTLESTEAIACNP